MIKINEIQESNIEYKSEVIELSKEAEQYLSSLNWCKKIIEGCVVKEWGYILAIFYFKIEPSINSNADNFVWVIVGDLPPAYIDIQSAKNEYEALNSYVFLMEDWINHAKKGLSVDECFPINVEPTEEYAAMLASRVEIIKDFLKEYPVGDAMH